MERYFKRKSPELAQPATNDFSRENINVPQSSSIPSMPKLIDLNQLSSDPHDRKRILDCHPNQRDEIRRAYILRGPCRPEGYIYPIKMIGEKPRRFNPKWFESFDWLEYSVKLDKVFCLPCYLFNDQVRTQVGSDAFVSEGFGGWNKMQERLEAHIGKVGSVHNKAIKNCDALMRQHQSIAVALHKQSDITKNEYRIRLNASIDVSRYLLNGLLPFRGHDESEKSFHRGHFLELMKYTQNQNEGVRKVTLKNAPGNSQMVSPKIQKDICHCFAQEILKSILSEIGDHVFALLVDESSDVSKKEQMAIVLRYVDDTCGLVKERFVGLVHVKETSALTLKSDRFQKMKTRREQL
ncbi:zinc finger MYM-type protein 1-like [Heracleum sosnowskyi]|uniref:Zinc finger MYM-type protein 1-like n=1 Tax=Heracleum sosnowskyi TaxID=360622 RepID=A0AAD8H1Y1_9APIA|nr:zinc finger MYM-type protein 1-like [Heracleum sosnowskyi]